MQTLKKLIYLLSLRERTQAIFLLFLIIVMAFLDMLGIASILPFMAVLTNPSIIDTNIFLNKMFEISSLIGIETTQEFLFALGVAVFILLVTSLLFKALMVYFEIKFTLMREYSIGKRLIEGYLHQPYSWFLNHHSANLGKNILSEVSLVVSNGISPMLIFFSHSAVAIAIISLLVVTDPKLSLIACTVLASAYLLVSKFTGGLITRLGKYRLEANQMRFKIVNEAFGAVKEIKIRGFEDIYVSRFSKPSRDYSEYHAVAGAIGQLPRYIIEIITFGGMLFLILYLLSQKSTFLSIVPIMALFAFAGYRLIPALQQIYLSVTKLRFIGPALNTLHSDLSNLKLINSSKTMEPIVFNKCISLENVNYNYPNSTKTAIKDININIPFGSTIGLVGTTGSGKSTTVDIILGLLEPQKGNLKVDNKIINIDNRRAWQNSIGYVPQQIFLSDDTIEANIAFGINTNKIDINRVREVSRIANLHEFVINELPNQYLTKVGERGVRLSGGQRQRIGIARALYHNPSILVFDEATSALDNMTENLVMNSVHNLSKDITIIIIAHRLSTVTKCDKIFILENGIIKNEGNFEELAKVNKNFRMYAKN